MSLRVLLADDHQIVRQGLRVLLEHAGFDVVADAVDGSEAVRLAHEFRPDVAILDLIMPQLNGLDAGREIRRRDPGVQVVLLTMRAEEHQVAEALRVGIRGYVLKTQASDDLVHAIRAVTAGQTYLSPAVSHLVVTGYLSGAQAPTQPLAPRERQVLQLVAEGKTSKAIAAIMGLSVKTAESYRARVMDKLEIHETAGLVRYAIRHGIVEP
jgi:DNA-binding NarL/FixJ family response regulator